MCISTLCQDFDEIKLCLYQWPFLSIEVAIWYSNSCLQPVLNQPLRRNRYPLLKVKMRTLAILCVVLAAFYTYSEACRCETKHPQKQFCEADFGMYFWDFFFFYKFTDLVIIYLLKNIKYIFQKNNRNLP